VALALLVILNVVDGAATLYWLEHTPSTEANPAMATAYSLSPVWFAFSKFALVTLSATLLWRLREDPFAHKAAYVMLIAYVAVVAWHFYGLGLFLS
jgi:hypothetical protein